jgi:hypothetical protein
MKHMQKLALARIQKSAQAQVRGRPTHGTSGAALPTSAARTTPPQASESQPATVAASPEGN